MKKNDDNQKSCMDLLFKYYSPLDLSYVNTNNNSEKKNYKNINYNTDLITNFKTNTNYSEMECQDFNLNGNYKKIYIYKDDEDNSEDFNNNNLDIQKFCFKDFKDEINPIKEEKKIQLNNMKNIKNLSNAIKNNISFKMNGYKNIKTKKLNLKKNLKKVNKNNTKIKKKENKEIIEKTRNNIKLKESTKNLSTNPYMNNVFKIINLSKLNNKSQVILSKKDDMITEDIINKNKKIIIEEKTSDNIINKVNKENKKIKNIKLSEIHHIKKKKIRTKFSSSQSMKKLNSIIEDYYKSKNIIINNNEKIEKNEKKQENNIIYDEIKPKINKFKITYSSSCDNKKIRRNSSCFHEPKVTIFQHYNGKHTINNDYRSQNNTFF